MPDFNGFDPVLAAEKHLEDPPTKQTDHGDDSMKMRPKKRFFANPKGAILSAEQARRQGQVTSAAFVALGQAGAIAFLNGHNEDLGGRPIDLAIDSVDGLAAVEASLSGLKRGDG